MGECAIGVLGPFAVLNGARVELVPGMPARLGSFLALFPGEVVPREAIIEQLWGARPPATADNTIQVLVSRLRALLGTERVVWITHGYMLDGLERDDHRFIAHAQEAARALDSGQHEVAYSLACEALALWRGQPFAGVNGAQADGRRAVLQEYRVHLEEMRLSAQLERASSGVQRLACLAESAGLVAQYPHRHTARQLHERAKAIATASDVLT